MEHTSLEDHKIFCIWSGNNQMSDNRKRCLQSLEESADCEVILVTPNNLDTYILKDNPLHPAYEYLSLTHKADYLRAYLMYHHGGGYSDIKLNNNSWEKYFSDLNQSDKQFSGYAEVRPEHVASNYDFVKRDFHKLPGVVHFVFKKNTSLAKSWLEQVDKILDIKYELLKKYPGDYHPRAVYGGAFGTSLFKDAKYPLGWNEILAMIFHELCYHNSNIYSLSMHYPNTHNYR